jgi:hypothetical protein
MNGSRCQMVFGFIYAIIAGLVASLAESELLGASEERKRHIFVRWVTLPEGKQPTDLSREKLKLSFIE